MEITKRLSILYLLTVNRGVTMNNNTRNEFASFGLDILKRSVLLVLYEETDTVYGKPLYPNGRILKAEQTREKLNILQPRLVVANTNSLIHGLLDHLRHDGHAYHYVSQGWAITEKGVKAIVGVTVAREAQRGSEANTLEDRVEIGRKVAELRINAAGSKGIAWRKIRERLGLKNNEFHNGIRLEDHFRESVVKRIESFEDGWECQVDLTVLCGFEPTGEWLDRIETCRP